MAPKNPSASRRTICLMRRARSAAGGGASRVACPNGSIRAWKDSLMRPAYRRPDPLSLNSMTCHGPSGGRWKSQALKKHTSGRFAGRLCPDEPMTFSCHTGRVVTFSKTRMKSSISASTAAGIVWWAKVTENSSGTPGIPAARSRLHNCSRRSSISFPRGSVHGYPRPASSGPVRQAGSGYTGS